MILFSEVYQIELFAGVLELWLVIQNLFFFSFFYQINCIINLESYQSADLRAIS